jgi:outer membrane protein insertion porin family
MRLLFLFLVAWICFIADEVEALLPFDNQVVSRIDIEFVTGGKGKREAEVIRGKITTKKGSFFSQSQFDSDLKMLAQEYDWVEPSVIFENEQMVILVKLWQKPQIRSICFEGNQSFSDSTLLGELELEDASVYDRALFSRAFQKLRTFYAKKGYFEAEVNYSVAEDPTNNCVDIEITVCEGRSGRISSLAFCGLDNDEIDDIVDCMVTQPWNIVSSFMTGMGHYDQTAAEYDQYQVLNYLQNRGYADAKVEIDAVPSCDPRWLDVHIHASREKRYLFGEITYEGNEVVCDEVIDQLIKAEEGQCFAPDAIRDTLKNLQDIYGSKGYIEAIIDEDLTLREDEEIYDLHITIEEGEQYRVGLIKIFGNNYTQNRVILHETLLCPGEIFNTIKLSFTEERLRNIGYFDTVNVYAVRSSEEGGLGPNYRDVHIEVHETPTGSFGAFMGFSTGDDLFGGFNITEKNFNILGLNPETLKTIGPRALKGGGEFAHFTATIGQKTNSFVLSWTKPYFMDTPWAIGSDAERNWNGALAEDYEILSHTGTVHLRRNLNAFISVGTHYRIRNSVVHSKEKAKLESIQLREISGNNGWVSGAGFSLIYNSTNHPLRPSSGLRSRLDGEYVGLGGSHKFMSLSYVNSMYQPFGSNGVLKLRADFKFIQPLDIPKKGEESLSTIPLDERLMLGGDYLVRGYRPYAIGPKFNNLPDPRGGLSLVLLSIEYNKPLLPMADFFLFSDAGYLSKRSWDVNTDNLKVSIGFGMKLAVMGPASPPIVIGYGFPLNADNRSDIKRFFISMGAKF